MLGHRGAGSPGSTLPDTTKSFNVSGREPSRANCLCTQKIRTPYMLAHPPSTESTCGEWVERKGVETSEHPSKGSYSPSSFLRPKRNRWLSQGDLSCEHHTDDVISTMCSWVYSEYDHVWRYASIVLAHVSGGHCHAMAVPVGPTALVLAAG